MGIWIGIDGGGTKTKFLAVDESGKRLASYIAGGAYYHLDGIETVCARLAEGIGAVKGSSDILGICFGMPGFGESTSDDEAVERIRLSLSPYNLYVVNDVEVGWAGSLALSPGVNIVAGTGSIAYGRNQDGFSARSGGWMEFFSDEGSGYWLGRRTLELFAKQSDGRIPKDKLYELLKAHLNLQNDNEMNSLVRDAYALSREKTASLQRVLFEAAKAGDRSAIKLYQEAGQELALIADAVIRKLKFSSTPTLSYSGGVFETGDLILKPFRASMKMQAKLAIPALEPVEGAVLLAVERFAPQELPKIKNALLQRGN